MLSSDPRFLYCVYRGKVGCLGFSVRCDIRSVLCIDYSDCQTTESKALSGSPTAGLSRPQRAPAQTCPFSPLYFAVSLLPGALPTNCELCELRPLSKTALISIFTHQ